MTCEKRDIYHEVKALLHDWYPEEMAAQDVGRCFYWAHCGWKVLVDHGFDVLFQAGSMSWPFIPQSEWANFEGDTHFSYLWTPTEPASVKAMSIGKMPEIHIWLAIPARHELVDFSTGTLKAHAESDGDRVWTGPLPPDYLWCNFDDIPFGVFYKAELDATRFLLKRIEDDLCQNQ